MVLRESKKLKNINYDKFESTIQNILDSNTYRYLKYDVENIAEYIMKWIEDVLKKAFEGKDIVKDISTVSKPIANIVLVLMIIGVIVLIMYILYKVLDFKKVDNNQKTILGEIIKSDTKSDYFLGRAGKMEDDKRYRDSIRLGFIGLLLKLHENKIIFLEEVKTNKEFVNEVRYKNGSYVDDFQIIVDYFNEVYYGNKNVGEGYYANWKDKLNLLWSEVNMDE